MTGWRIGYACGHADIIAAMNKIHQYTMLCAPIMGQMAALEALRHGEPTMRKMVEDYNYRRRVMLQGLADIGLDCFEPGAFSFPHSGYRYEQRGVRRKAAAGRKVAVVPGNAFGPSGEGFIWLPLRCQPDNIEEALSAWEFRNAIE